MKSLLLIYFFICVLGSYAQNIEDAYSDHKNDTIWEDDLDTYTGEYKIFLNKHFWAYFNSDTANPIHEVSYGFKIVSFPFIPKEFAPDEINDLTNLDIRQLNMRVIEDGYWDSINTGSGTSSSEYFEGLGWEYGKYYIFSNVFNTHNCDVYNYDKECQGDIGLISEVFANGNYVDTNDPTKCLLPHTIIKQSLYFHCVGDDTSYVIDSISWLYDNTRGKMKEYPFIPTEVPVESTKNTLIDVVFRPSFVEVPYYWGYAANGNSNLYSSGHPNGSTGSIDYFPPSQVDTWNFCGDLTNGLPLLYYNPNADTNQPGHYGNYAFFCNYSYSNNQGFVAELVHPPSYILLDAPLLSYDGVTYAGYYSNGNEQPGIAHEYLIDTPFDLRIINPDEKIIYNPSEVTLECDLTFPCGYQFITLRGKYADREYEVHNNQTYSSQWWDLNSYFDFEYDKDYPIPVHDSINAHPRSIYRIEGCTLTIQTPIIIMDADFVGGEGSKRGYIRGNPEHIFGNWTIDSNITFIEDYSVSPEYCIGDDLDSTGKSFPIEVINNNHSEIIVMNSGSYNPQLKINRESFIGSIVRIYNSIGVLIFEVKIISINQNIDCSSFKRGIYHAVLIQNDNIREKISFCKM